MNLPKKNTVNKNPLTRAAQQKQVIIASDVEYSTIISSIASYALKMHIIAIVGRVVGLVCMSFALYNILP
ncbi:MAG: hypothetical protein ACR5KW_00100 [Wolbachia sp.]